MLPSRPLGRDHVDTRRDARLVRAAPRGTGEACHPRGDAWIVARSGAKQRADSIWRDRLGPLDSPALLQQRARAGLGRTARAADRERRRTAPRDRRTRRAFDDVRPRALEQIARQLIDFSMAEIPKLLGSPNTVFNVEGWRRPYFLGELTLNHLLRTFPHHELFERLLAVIAAMQVISDDKLAPLRERTRRPRVRRRDVGCRDRAPDPAMLRAGDPCGRCLVVRRARAVARRAFATRRAARRCSLARVAAAGRRRPGTDGARQSGQASA